MCESIKASTSKEAVFNKRKMELKCANKRPSVWPLWDTAHTSKFSPTPPMKEAPATLLSTLLPGDASEPCKVSMAISAC